MEIKRLKLRIDVTSITATSHVFAMTAIDYATGQPLDQWTRIARNMQRGTALPDAVLLACEECRQRWPEFIVNPLYVNTEAERG